MRRMKECNPKALNNSCLLRLRQTLPDRVPPGLLRNHNRKPLKVVQRPPLLDVGPLLRPRGLVPLVDRALFLEVLFDDAG